MQNKNNNQKGTMTKIRMNTELRNKLFNKIKHTFENEDTQEREAPNQGFPVRVIPLATIN